jgi:hypothetical protein
LPSEKGRIYLMFLDIVGTSWYANTFMNAHPLVIKPLYPFIIFTSLYFSPTQNISKQGFPIVIWVFFSAADAVLIYLRAHTSGNP